MIRAFLLFLAVAALPMVKVHGYVPTGRPTASGAPTVIGSTAACPDSLPLGTRIWIEGYGTRTCEDRCDRRRHPRGCYDLLVATEAEAYRVTARRRVAVVR